MSLTGINKLWNMTVKTREKVLKRYLATHERMSAQLKMKKRHLTHEPLEERHLLSLTIGSVEDIPVNTEWQDIRGEVAADINASNDVIAAWTAADRLTDPVTGEYLGEDLNVYARYLTDETQVVTIAVDTSQIGKGASFELLYGSATVHRLSFFSSTPIASEANSITYDPETGKYTSASNTDIIGSVTLSLNGNECTFGFDTNSTPTTNAQNIQAALRSLGADYSEIEVVAHSETEFDITYLGDNFVGTIPELTIAAQDYTSGSTPSALIETISTPTAITNYSLLTGKQIGITITSNAAAMASQIEKAFERTADDAYYAPIMRQWYYDPQTLRYVLRNSDTLESAYAADFSYDYYTTRVFPNLDVNVTALETQVEGNYTYFRFEVTFTGNSGYRNHQELVVSSLHVGGTEMIEDGYVYVNGNDPLMNGLSLVETIKESSPVFRVNAPEEADYAKDNDGNVIYDKNGDPILIGTGKTNQYNPDVSFADNGMFVVAWQSDIDETIDRYNYTDIFARYFTIQGYSFDKSQINFYTDGGMTGEPLANVDPYLENVDEVSPVECVRPLRAQFRVNVETNGTQEYPCVSCDSAGNFVISWTSDSQWNSYFAGIVASWYDSSGLGITGDVIVTQSDPAASLYGTPVYGESYVAMDSDGVTVIVWTEAGTLYKSLYGAQQYAPFVERAMVANNSFSPSVDFDNNGHYVLAWTAANATIQENLLYHSFSTVMAELFEVTHDEQLVYSETSLGSGDIGSTEGEVPGELLYVLNVGNVSVGMDADGDMFFAYQGFGYDVQANDTRDAGIENNFAQSNYVYLSWEEVQKILAKTGNEDLENYFKAWFGVTSSTGRYSYIDYLDSNYLIDGDTISINPGATSLTLGFVDPDDYIKAALSSIQRQMKQTFYDESYKDYFASTFDIITTLYEKWSEKYGELLDETQEEWTEKFFTLYPGIKTMTIPEFLADTSQLTDPFSEYYGMTYAEVAAIYTSKTSNEYLFFFESALTSALEDYYESDTSIETIWREALSHIYSGDELDAKVAEKVVEVIEESIAGNIQALETYLVANPGTTPDEALEVLIADEVIPDVEWDYFERSLSLALTSYYKADHSIDPADIPTLIDADVTAVKTYAETLGIPPEDALNALIMMGTVPAVEAETFLEQVQELVRQGLVQLKVNDYLAENFAAIHIETLKKIDEKVISDLTSTYKVSYDAILQQKIDNIVSTLSDMTYDDFATSTTIVLNPASVYYGKTYAETTAIIYAEEYAKWPQPGSSEWDAGYQDIYESLYDQEFETYYERYWEELRPEHTHGGVVDYIGLANAAVTKAEETIADEAYDQTEEWAFRQLFEADLRAEEEKTGAIRDELKLLSDKELRTMYLSYYTAKHPELTEDEIARIVNLAPVLRMINDLVDYRIEQAAQELADAARSKTGSLSEDAEALIEERTRERMLSEVAAEDTLYTDYLLAELDEALTTYHTSEIADWFDQPDYHFDPSGETTRREGLLNQYKSYLQNTKQNSLRKTYTSAVKELLTNLIYYPEEYCARYSAMKDETLDETYGELIRSFYTDSKGNLSNEAREQWETAIADATRFEKIWTLAYNAMYDIFDTTVISVLGDYLLDQYKRSDDYRDDIDTLVTEYNANYYLSYYAMDFNELKEAYREQMISKYGTADDLDAAMATVASDTAESRDVMATCLAKADLAVDYRALRYELLNKEVNKKNSEADKLLQSYANAVVSAYNGYYAMDYSDLLQEYIQYLIERYDFTEAEAAEYADFYSEGTTEDRILLSLDMATYDARESTKYDPDKASTFNSSFRSQIWSSEYDPTITPETAAETAMEAVKETYGDVMYVSVDLLALAWQIDSASLDDMVQALAENCVAIKYAGLVAENVDTTVSNIIYNAIYDYTGETFAMNEYSLLDGQTSEITVDVDIPRLFEGIFTQWITWKETTQEKDEIRAQHETARFIELRPTVEATYHDAYREEFLSRFTDANGNVDEWSLEQAVQAAIDAETINEVDQAITAEAESRIDAGHVADLVSLYMDDATPILDSTVTVDFDEINASTKAIVLVLLDAEIETEAWALVDAETDRLISLRVEHDLKIWQSVESSEAEKTEIEDKANSVLSGTSVRKLAEQDMIDRQNYADNAIHEEVQSSIVYDGLYSNYWNRYSESYRESLGKEWTYLDLLSDDETTFQANEFSPWHEMTYAEICTYLTTEYTAQYPDQTEDKIQGMVKKTMLDWVLVPDAVHAQTMKQVEAASELVMYGTVYEEMYEKYADSVKDTIYDDIHDIYYEPLHEKFHDSLYSKYYSDQYTNAVAQVTATLTSTYSEEIAKAAEESGMSVDDYIAKVLEDLDNGIQPSWLPEGTTLESPKSIAESATESQIDSYVNTLIRGIAETYVIDYGTISTYTREKIDELIDEMIYDIIDNDPIYIAKKADIIGRANAVMEYNLRHLRGEGNGIYFTTYAADFSETDYDQAYSNGIVNALRDGNNQKYYIGIPSINISSGTLVLDALWEGNCNDFVEMTVSVGAVIRTENGFSYLDIPETIKAMINAFTEAAGEYADWQDGMFDSIQVVDVTGQQSLVEGTDWAWDNYSDSISGYSLAEAYSNSTYWKEDYVIFEITFQGGAHDSRILLDFNSDNSTLAYAIDNDYYDVLKALKDNAAVKINDVDIEFAARVHDLLATRVSGSVYYDDYIAALATLYSGLDDESTVGELVVELAYSDKTMTTAVFNLLQRVMNTIDYDQYDFYQDVKGLLDDNVVRQGNAPHLYDIFTFVTDGTYASGTFTDFYNLLRHFYVPRQPDQDPISHSTVINAENEVDWENDPWLSTTVDTAYGNLDEMLNPGNDVLKFEYILAESLTGSRGKRQINATVGMNDSGNIVVVWQQQKTLSRYTVTSNGDGSYSYRSGILSDDSTYNSYGDSVAQAGKLSTQTQCTQIYLRSLIESTDYAGARVTSLSLPNGVQISDGGTVTSATKDLIVTFTENLQTTTAGYSKTHAVDNPDNWMVLKDGVLLQNVIENITFSMSASRFLAAASDDERINGKDNNPDSLIYGSNQYEAVITFKDGYELTEGNYTLVATNMIHDIAGNAINSNGAAIDGDANVTGRDGYNTEVSFTVVPLDKPLAFGDIENENFGSWSRETKVDDTVGNSTSQWTTEQLLDDAENYTANSPNAVASDASGNFVVVWTQSTKNDEGVITSGGIYFKVYHEEYVIDADGCRQERQIGTFESQAVYFELDGNTYRYYSDETKANELQIGINGDGIPLEDFAVPQQASVTIDNQGNFVIVWDMLAADDQLGHKLSRDVFARRYALSGRELGVNGFTLPYRINIETEEDQQNASVAMDADGDFVIVWESWKQDGSGWGVYGRRFDDTGYSFGRSNTVDIIAFVGTFAETGNYMDLTFTDLDGAIYEINGIVLSEAITKTCANIEEALLALKDSGGNHIFQNGKEGTEYEQYVRVTRHGNNSVNIEFIGSKYAYSEIDDLKAVVYDAPAIGATTGGTVSKTLKVNVSVYSLGVDGTEFSVNETTLGDQRFPAIGMNAEGTFVVTWTAWGQDGDSAVESNIYARQFVSNHSLISTSVTVTTPTSSGDITATIASLDSTVNHVGDSIRQYTGVAYVGIGSSTIRTVTGDDESSSGTGTGENAEYGTGELLSTGYHVLTAAHLLYGTDGSIDPSTVYVSFVNTAGDIFTYTAKEIYIHPDYAGNYLTQADVAIIVLDECVDSSITRYDIYRNSDELNQNFVMVGFGTASRVTKDNERVENEDDGAANNDNTTAADQATIASKHFGWNTFDLYGTDISAGYNYNTLLFDFDDGTRKYDTFGNSYGVVNYGLGDNETMGALGDSGGPCFIDGKVAGVISWSNSPTPGTPTPGDYAAAVRVSAYADWIDMICAGITTKEFLVNTVNVSVVTTGATTTADSTTTDSTTDTGATDDIYQKGVQIWSDVAVDDFGNFVITWTGFNQDGYGDTASGGSSNGLGGIYMRRYYHDTEYVLESGTENDEPTTTTAAGGSVVYYFTRTGTITTQYVSDVALVNEYTGFDQIKSKIDMDTAGNFVISWTSYQNRVFGTDNPVADGIYARQYINTADYYAALGDYYGISTDEDSENTTNPPTGTTTATAGATSPPDGIPPAVDGAATGDGTTTPPTTTPSTTTPPAATDPVTTDPAATDVTVTDTTAAPGIYATGNFAEITGWIRGYFPVSEDFRHANVEIKTGSIGGAFKVNALSSADLNSPALDNQRGGSVTVNANGDMIFVWTDLNDESTPDAWDARVTYRTITNGEEDVPPTVTTVTAAFGDPGTESGKFSNVSLMGDIVTFTKDHGPSAVIYTFSELMYAKEFILQVYDDVNLDDSEYPTSPHLTTLYASQDSTTRSVLNRTNWTMLCNNIPVTSSEIETIYYGLNAGYELGYSVDESGQYELVIVFTEQLQEGAYSITTKDIVTDLSKNRLDGNYDGVAGGSFTVRFNVGVSGVPSSYDDDDDNETDEETFANQTINHIDPEVVTFADGSYIIVTETNNDSVDDDNDDTVTGDDEGDEYTSNIVIRKFNASGEPDSADIIVNSYREGIQEDPDIDGYDYENFAVAWTGEGKDGKGVYVRFYNSGGQSTKEIRVNDVYLNGSNNRTYSAQVAFDDSSDAYLITWRQQKGANYVVLGKYYSVTGKELSRQFVVAEPTYMSMDHYHVSCQNGHYGIAWSEYLVSTNSTEVYAKTFTKAFGSWSITTRANTFMVNQTTSGSQYQVCADLDNDGNLYITWTSTQNLSTTDWDIYMRSFTFTGTPKVNETKVNQISFTDPFDSRQCEAYVSVDPEGAGYVITWSSKNTEGINYDIDLRTQLYDYGIMGCAFTADGQSINVDTGEPMNPYDATFVANKIINGNQRNSVVSVYGWDNGVPQFVVAWEGPLKVYDDDETDNTSDEEGGEPGSTITPIAGPNTNADDNRDLTYSEYTMVFHRCFPKRSSAMVVDIENALSSSSDATDLLLKDRLTDNASGSNGYYRPSNTEMLISNADLVNTAETVEIAGTEGNDLLEIITNAAGTSWTIYLNGTKVSGITAGSRIVFRGNAGTDRIAYSGSNSDSIMVNGITSSARFTGMAGALTANNVEQFEISGGGSETLTVYTTGAGDRVTVGNGDLKLTSSSRFSVTASNIEEVAVRGSSSDVAVILDSRESDTVLTRDGYVGMTGGGMVSEVYGIGNVRVLSENGGTDTITFERITGLLASQGQIVTQTPSMLVTAIGFDSINASGDVSATASLVGSKKADTFVGDSKSVVFTYNDGKMVSLSGIRSISITGNGGEDAATIVGDTGVNTLTARNGSATLTGNTYSRTINGFTKVNIGRPDESINSNYTAIVYDSVMDDTIVEEDNLVTVDFGGQEIYSLIAFDQISAKKEMNEGTDTTVSRNKLASIVFGNWN